MPEASPKPKAPTKGKPMGIPVWGWIAAVAAGLVIAFIIAKKSSASTSPVDAGNVGATSPLGSQSDNSGAGVVAPPAPDLASLLEQLRAMGLFGGGNISNPSGGSQPASIIGSDEQSPFSAVNVTDSGAANNTPTYQQFVAAVNANYSPPPDRFGQFTQAVATNYTPTSRNILAEPTPTLVHPVGPIPGGPVAD